MINLEIVISSGEIAQANKNSDTALFQALKGGTNNFGIVTRFVLPAFHQGKMWGGALYYPSTTYASIVQDFYDFASSPEPGRNVHLIAATAYSPLGLVNVVNVYYAKPTGLIPDRDRLRKRFYYERLAPWSDGRSTRIGRCKRDSAIFLLLDLWIYLGRHHLINHLQWPV